MRIHVAPPALVVGFVHPTEPVYGTVFRTDTVPPKTSHDFVSILYGDRGGLTTNTEPAGAALPEGTGGFRQVIPGESLDRLFRAHLDGLAYLKERGIQARPVSADTLQQDLRKAFRRQREVFLGSPVRSTFVTFWRSATKKVPFLGRLREQRIVDAQIARFLTEGTGANIFFVMNGVLQTPTTRNILVGISRQYAIELARGLDIPVEERDITLYEAYNAEEAFWTTSSYCILPICRIDGRKIGRSYPGPVAGALLEAWSRAAGVDIVAQAQRHAAGGESK